MVSIVVGWRILRVVPAVVLALTLTLGCSSQQPTPTGEQPAASGQEQPKYGGVLSVHYIETPPLHLNALIGGAATGIHSTTQAYNTLVRYDPAKSTESETVVPDIAERWEVSTDGKSVTFFLRKNARWHDGTPFTASDVKYTFDRIMNPNDPEAKDMGGIRAGMEMVNSVEIVDNNTVQFVLKQPSASLLSWLGYGSYQIVPKHAWETMDHAKDVMGTGPFKLKRYQAGVSIEYEKNSDYFLKDRPYLNEVKMFFLRDNATRVAAFTTNQIDMLRQIDKPMWEEIKKDVPDAQLVRWDVLRPLFVGLNLARKPYDDPRVRKSIFLALDRRAGNQLLVGDWGTIGGYIPPGPAALSQVELNKMPGYGNPQAQVAEAKKLLAEAGYANGFATNMITSNSYPLYEDASIWVKDQLKKILNINADVEILGGADYGNRRTQGQYDMITVHAVAYFIDPGGSANYWRPGNFLGFKDNELWDILAQQDQILDPGERKRVVNEMERKLLERGPYTVISWTKLGTALHPWVMNHYEPVGLYSGHKYDQVWLAK